MATKKRGNKLATLSEAVAKKAKRIIRKIATVLSPSTAKAIGDYSGKKAVVGKAITIAVDGLIADGVKPTMMYAPAKGADRTFYASLETAIIAGFSPAARAMLDSETKALAVIEKPDNREVKCKANKKYWQQQVGSGIKDLRKSLEKRLNPKKTGGSKDIEPMEQRIRRVLVGIAAELREATDVNITHLPDLLRSLDTAIGYIPAPEVKESKAA